VLVGESCYAASVEESRGRRHASVNFDVVPNALCSRTASNVFLNERMMSAQSLFRNLWTEVGKQERRCFFCFQ